MNKKLNTVLFILGATILNIVVMLLLMMIGLLIVTQIVGENPNPGTAQVLFLLVFAGSVAGAFAIYHRLIKVLSNKVDMDSHFYPIFGRRKR